MSNLYVLGNGFDIYHGMKTRYADFHKFVSDNNCELENNLDEYFNFELDDRYLWKNFEADLCHFNHKGFFSDRNNIDIMDDHFKPSECFGLEDEIRNDVERLIETIRKEFCNWILGIAYPRLREVKARLLPLRNNSIFINFNYTDTLEELYKIPKRDILYIHNNASEQFGELIFGHGESDEDDPAEEELDMNGDSNRTMFSDAQNAARAPFFELQKDTQNVITEHKDFFVRLANIQSVFVLGHSLGTVDLPYFHEIAKYAPLAKWYISYFNEEEKASHEFTALTILRIGKSRIDMIRINEV